MHRIIASGRLAVDQAEATRESVDVEGGGFAPIAMHRIEEAARGIDREERGILQPAEVLHMVEGAGGAVDAVDVDAVAAPVAACGGVASDVSEERMWVHCAIVDGRSQRSTMQSLPKAGGAEQITEALRRSGVLDTGRVAEVTVEKSFPTVLSYIFRLRLTYEGAVGDAPRSLILKAGLPDRPGGPWIGGRHEVAFYAQVASAMPAGLVPRCFDAHWAPDTGVWHLLLEDLTE